MTVGRRPVLVGEAPSRTSDPAVPFSGRSGTRLSALIGRPVHEAFEVRNLLDEWPGPAGKGSLFSRGLVHDRAVEILREQERGQTLLLAGRRVASAFAVSYPYLEVVGVAYPCVVIPHPSGVNRWFNDAANVERLALLLRSLV